MDKIEKVVDNITDNIVSKLDSKFINDNQDLKDEIYSLLKASSETNATNIRFKITYIPPNDIIHIYFKKDKLTHRGISDLADSLLPASLYSALYITNSIWSLTRAQDKRVYYINQSVDTNIASTLMNTVNQIMKGNMNYHYIIIIEALISTLSILFYIKDEQHWYIYN